MEITARSREQVILGSVLRENRAKLIAVYGRRRVGKTYLIREFFKDQGVYVEVIGLKDGTQSEQLEIFANALSVSFQKYFPHQNLANWKQAFVAFTNEVKSCEGKKVILFLDELPWLSTKKSMLIQQLDYFWNSHWSKMENLVVILCGSAASWMLEKLIFAKGGLHNRIDHTIRVEPFTLRETKQYFQEKNLQFTNKEILEAYLTVGGVPYYLNAFFKGLSIAQSINQACFSKNGDLVKEYKKLLDSLFSDSHLYDKILKTLSQHPRGLTQSDLFRVSGLAPNGRNYKRLSELAECGFIGQVALFNRAERLYVLSDEFIWFHFSWIARAPRGIFEQVNPNYWLNQFSTSSFAVWAGHSFERLCYKEVGAIAEVLGIGGVQYTAYSFTQRGDKSQKGAQIDLLFDREDGVITICEIKNNSEPFVVDKEYALSLLNKQEVFKQVTKTTKRLSLVLLCRGGVKRNSWSNDLIDQVVDLETLLF